MKRLEWHNWTCPEDVPQSKLLLLKIDAKGNNFETCIFRKDSIGKPFGVIGGRFSFDRKIEKWAIIDELVKDVVEEIK